MLAHSSQLMLISSIRLFGQSMQIWKERISPFRTVSDMSNSLRVKRLRLRCLCGVSPLLVTGLGHSSRPESCFRQHQVFSFPFLSLPAPSTAVFFRVSSVETAGGEGGWGPHLSCRSFTCEQHPALFLGLLLDLHFAQISQVLVTGFLSFSQFKRTRVLERVNPLAQLVRRDCSPEGRAACWPGKARRREHCQESRDFSRSPMRGQGAPSGELRFQPGQISPLPVSSLSVPQVAYPLATWLQRHPRNQRKPAGSDFLSLLLTHTNR